MRASKENAKIALKKIEILYTHTDSVINRYTASEWLKEFVEACQSRLPTEKAYRDDRNRRLKRQRQGATER